jgi:hypothetical protein
LKEIASPCIRNCCLDDDDICMGCYRSLGEILQWASASASQKEAILIGCEKRRLLSKHLYKPRGKKVE